MICPYCLNQAEWVENKEIYGRNYGHSFMAWLCRSCDAYVGCHNNTRKPLGTIANKKTREWRKKAHEAFDPLWRNKRGSKRKATRQSLYDKVSHTLGYEVHIGGSDIETCKKIIDFCGKV